MLPEALSQQIKSLDVDDRVQMGCGFAGLAQTLPELTIGSACSGSEVMMYVVEEIQAYWQREHGIDVKVKHSFACEAEPWKQKWILDNFAPGLLFDDIKQIFQSHAKDIISGDMKPVPSVHLFAAGFECDSVSSLFSGRSEFFGSCIQRGVGKTGSTGASTVEYIREHRPLSFVLENVKGLMSKSSLVGEESEKDIDVLCRVFRELGYAVHYRVLQASHFGAPQDRERVFIWGVMVCEKDQNPEKAPVSFMQIGRVVEKLHIAPLALEDFLVADDDPRVLWWKASQAEIHDKEGGQSNGKGEHKYDVDHLDAYLKASLPWPPALGDFSSKVSHLPRRQGELAYLIERTVSDSTGETCHDLNMSADWISTSRPNMCHCLVSSSRPWLRRRQRDMIGDEALAIQGFDLARQRDPPGGQGPTSVNKLDLSGNAFSGFVVCGVLLAMWSNIEWVGALKIHDQVLLSLRCHGSVDSDSGEGQESESADGDESRSTESHEEDWD